MPRNSQKKEQSTTAKILSKRKRKKLLRQLYELALIQEAEKMGITVAQLKQQRFLEAESARKKSAEKFIVKGGSSGKPMFIDY